MAEIGNRLKISSREGPPVIRSRLMFQIFCDFDGTITNRDSIVFLTEEYGRGPEFRRQVVDAIREGEITVFEAIRRELETVKLTWPQARRVLLENIQVDPTFPRFADWCGRRGWPLAVVSSGLEPVVSLFVGGLGVPVFAHPVECRKTGWIYRKRKDRDKVGVLKAARGKGRVVYIGDGLSDLPAIPLSDLLFACGYLAEHCARQGVPHHPFDDFDDIRRRLDELAGTD